MAKMVNVLCVTCETLAAILHLALQPLPLAFVL